jgi:hypothetical protein
MAHTTKPDFIFRRNGRVHVTRRGDSSVDYWQPRCVDQLVAFVLCWRGYALQSCETWWILTPFSCCPFIAPPTHHRVPCHLNRTLPIFQSTPPITLHCHTPFTLTKTPNLIQHSVKQTCICLHCHTLHEG